MLNVILKMVLKSILCYNKTCIYLPVCLLILYCYPICAQQQKVINPVSIPPSPDAAGLGIFGEYKMDNNSGKTNLTIPLYELRTSRFRLPITLNYVAFNGVRVDERSGWTGLGWVLDLGGAVSRTINGGDDFAPTGFKNIGLRSVESIVSEGATQNNLNYLKRIEEGYEDTKPDNFYFNINGRSGKFIFTPGGQIEMIESNVIKVKEDNGNSFVLTDEDGNEYQFYDKEYVSAYFRGDVALPSGYSTWYLSKMISADKTDTIKFEYISDYYPTQEYSHSFSQSYQADDNCTGIYNLGPEISGMTTRKYTSLRLKKISFSLGYIELTSVDHREDGGGRRLSKMEVYAVNPNLSSYEKIRTIDFHTDYFTANENVTNSYLKKRLKLDSLTIDQNQKYRFGYSEIKLPAVNSFAQDEWGYYNGQLTNTSLLKARQDIVNNVIVNVGSANRDLSSAHIEAGILKKVTYPTKGYSVFEYANNQFVKSYRKQTNEYISCVANGDMTPVNSLTFTMPESLTGPSVMTVNIRKFSDLPGVNSRPFVRLTDLTTNQVIFVMGGDPHNDLLRNDVAPLIAGRKYQLYAEAIGNRRAFAEITIKIPVEQDVKEMGEGFGLRVKRVVNYNADNSVAVAKEYRYGQREEGTGIIISAQFNKMGYAYTGEYITGSSGGFGGCTRCNTKRKVYLGNSFYNLSSFSGNQICYEEIAEYTTNMNKANGKMVSKYTVFTDRSLPVSIIYPNTIYQIPFSWPNGKVESVSVFKEINGSYVLTKESLYDYENVERSVGKGIEIGKGVVRGGCADQFISLGDQFSDYYIFDYPIYSGVRRVKNITEKNYDNPSNPLASGANLFYNDKYQVIKKIVNRSDGTSYSEENTYTSDVEGTGNSIVSNMIQRNMLNSIIEKKTVFSSNFILDKYNYVNPYPHFFVLGNVESRNLKNNIYESILSVNKYSENANVMSYKRNDGIYTIYLYSYRGSYPIFEIKNADLNTVVSVMGGNEILKDLENKIPSDQELKSISDLLRNDFRLSNSQITSYTYKPLVGMTSKTDAKGQTEYYQYDGFQRLQHVLDQFQQLRQSYHYHYRP
ncbi:Uncharacterised protein [Sphingobacterium spiritivorum]|uniref:YD repeat (Two copies) n=2 Tax=Sphingobacterium spiritivorum TaxID=258 RepID=A0A380BJV4_SPHSI|nr:Uncharacterised protein [Sphingobacterium spiritivorum]